MFNKLSFIIVFSSFQQIGTTSQSNKASGGAVTKPVLAPGRKSFSSNDFSMPQLNKDLVEMFNAKEASSSKFKVKESHKKTSVTSENSTKPFEMKNSANNYLKITQPSVCSSATNFAKVNPVSSVPSESSNSSTVSANPTPPWKKTNIEKKITQNNKAVGKAAGSLESQKPVYPIRQVVNKFSINDGAKAKQEASVEPKKSTSNVKPIFKVNHQKPKQPSDTSDVKQ